MLLLDMEEDSFLQPVLKRGLIAFCIWKVKNLVCLRQQKGLHQSWGFPMVPTALTAILIADVPNCSFKVTSSRGASSLWKGNLNHERCIWTRESWHCEHEFQQHSRHFDIQSWWETTVDLIILYPVLICLLSQRKKDFKRHRADWAIFDSCNLTW